MYRTSVESDAIRSVGYDREGLILEIEFADGAIYHYLQVPADVHETFMAVESKGIFFQQFIRDRYQTVWIR